LSAGLRALLDQTSHQCTRRIERLKNALMPNRQGARPSCFSVFK